MQAWDPSLLPDRTLRAQLPENNTAIQMMENLLTPLKSLNTMWLSPSSTTFAMDMVLAFVCGLGLYLLLLPWLPAEPSLPPSRRTRTIRKHPVRMRLKNRSRKRTGALTDCQLYQKLDKTVVSLLKSFKKLLPDQGSPQQPSHPQCHPPVCKKKPATAPQPYREHEDSATLSSAEADSPPLTQHLPPLASSASSGWSTTSSDFGDSTTSFTASQLPESLPPLERISPCPLPHTFSPPCPPNPATTPQPWWDTTEKPDQQLGPHRLSHSKTAGIHFEQKWNQLFWGLPSLHSESLVADAWIAQNPSPLQPPPFLFNKISTLPPAQGQDKIPPQALSYLDPQAPPMILSTAGFQPPPPGQVLTQAHLQPFPQSVLPHCVAHVRDFGAVWSTPHNNPKHLIPIEIQHPGGPTLKTQTQHKRPSLSTVQGWQEDCRMPSLSPNHWATAIPPMAFSLSPEHWKLLEQHIQKVLNQHHGHQARRIPEPLELTQLQCHVALTCQAKEKCSPSECCSMSTAACSEGGQEVEARAGRAWDRNVGRSLGKVPRDRPMFSERASVPFPREISAQSERIMMNPTDQDAGNDSQLVAMLEVHLAVKSRQIRQGLIPLRLRRSWLSVPAAFPTTCIPEMSSSAVRKPARAPLRGFPL
ncbi:spermatogenesis-associated protein 31A3-like isoform X2 [Cavia porcellus]|uniref:spermatogenesis-associated protein 31A3-like isoform X2 n=1 Tax=Cavia porcellus TaxID=10141 RepID=UPI002FE32F90